MLLAVLTSAIFDLIVTDLHIKTPVIKSISTFQDFLEKITAYILHMRILRYIDCSPKTIGFMELLKQLLQADNLTITDLDAEVKALGFTPESLTDDQTSQVFDKLKAKYKNSKTTKRTSAMAKSENTPDSRPVSAIEFLRSDLGKGIHEVNAELDQLAATVQEVVDTVVESKAQSMFSLIKSIPQLTSGRVKELIEASNGDMQFFRQSPVDLKASLLSEFGIK